MVKRSDLSGILELPVEITRHVSQFLTTRMEYTLCMSPSRDYPFRSHIWSLVSCNCEHIGLRTCLKSSIDHHNRSLEIDWSPAICPEKAILMILSDLQQDLKKFCMTDRLPTKECEPLLKMKCVHSVDLYKNIPTHIRTHNHHDEA